MLEENACTDVTLYDQFKSVFVSHTFTVPSISFEAVWAATLVSTNEILANESAQLTVLFTLINIYRNDKTKLCGCFTVLENNKPQHSAW